ITVLGTLAALAYFTFYLVSVAFRLGTRMGIRSALVVAMPMLAGSYLYAIHREALCRIQAMPAVARFTISLAAGMLAMASLRFFLALYPLPVPELAIASCIAFLAFGSGAIPGLSLDPARSRSDAALAPFYGIAAGLLLYVLLLGVPQIVPG